ncbi:MAG TPA: hypothetical protein VF824_04385 [Thermoanaerobaculia bacterium]
MTQPEDRALSCPQCGAPRAGLYAPCHYCGSKFVRKRIAANAPPVVRAELPPRRIPIVREHPRRAPQDARTIVVSAVAALLLLVTPYLNNVARAALAVLHDLGHFLGGWLMAQPSFPIFAFDYPGAGAIETGGFSWPVALLIAGALAYGGWRYAALRPIVLASAIVWLIFVTSAVRRDVFFAAAGHLFELGVALACFRRSAFAALLIDINLIAFAWRIATDRIARDWYRVETGSGRADLFVLAQHLHTSAATLAVLLLLAALALLAVFAVSAARSAVWRRSPASATAAERSGR